MTSGNMLPATILKKSFLRKVFFLPHIYIEYQVRGLRGLRNSTMWIYPSEVIENDHHDQKLNSSVTYGQTAWPNNDG